MLDFDKVKEEAVGRWDGIFSALGIEVGDGRHTACPICCGGKDRFRFDNKEGKGTWFCSQCDPHSGDGWALLQKVLGLEFKEAIEQVAGIVGTVPVSKVAKENGMTTEKMREIFVNSQPASENNIVGRYLTKRGLKIINTCLRYSKRNQNAMLAVFSMPDGEAVTMHRTYLDNTGEKLDIESVKKILPPLKKMTGGAVRLFDADKNILAVTEGIETGIAVHEETHMPVWACLSSTLLESFEPPKNVTHIAIFGDNDVNYTGQKAAYTLANRLMTRQNRVTAEVYIPEIPGEDWLDNKLRNDRLRLEGGVW
jgi:putative DNA primase/helicase